MGLIDELRDEATQCKVADANAKTEGERSNAEAHARPHPLMVALHRCFKEFAEHLSVLGRDIETTCEIGPFGLVGGLCQENFR
ncbi:MAG: hypothetical protein CMO26_04280 [Thiotrichales bacterium]|nr:hypothetical protein [Thiotrichales bacterium]|tara:strand:- start:384 stop:632 length:249 start_codon:yes stop_codon:yes gene_type:complete